LTKIIKSNEMRTISNNMKQLIAKIHDQKIRSQRQFTFFKYTLKNFNILPQLQYIYIIFILYL